MKSEIRDPQELARPRECSTDTLRVVREDPIASSWLSQSDVPGFDRVFEAFVIACRVLWVFRISHEASATIDIVITPLKAAYFVLAARRSNRKVHNVPHWDARTPLSAKESVELV